MRPVSAGDTCIVECARQHAVGLAGGLEGIVSRAALHHKTDLDNDVAVVGLDTWEIISTQARLPLTTVDMNLRGHAAKAAKPLLAMVEGAQDSGIVRLPCSLIIRESCGSR